MIKKKEPVYVGCPVCERTHTITNHKETLCICGAELDVIRHDGTVILKQKEKQKFKHRRIS